MRSLLPSRHSLRQRGFTMLEVVVAIMMVAGMMILLSNAFAPHLAFKQRMDSQARLNELMAATDLMYRGNAFLIDDADEVTSDTRSPLFASLGQIAVGMDETTGTLRKMSTTCSAQRNNPTDDTPVGDPGDIRGGPVPQVVNLLALQPYTTHGLEDLAKDGFNNVICVLISKRATIMYEGQPLYYHVIAYVSPGANNMVEADTGLVPEVSTNGVDDVWTLNIGGDDRGVVYDGSKVAIDNYKVTKARLNRFARAYESYFKSRYQSQHLRDTSYNYFYLENPAAPNNGEPVPTDPSRTYAEPEVWPGTTNETLAAWDHSAFNNVIDTGLWKVLGMNDSDLIDSWNFPILVDNYSRRVRPGMSGGNVQVPPFSAQFGAFLPGMTECATTNPGIGDPNQKCVAYLTSTALSTY